MALGVVGFRWGHGDGKREAALVSMLRDSTAVKPCSSCLMVCFVKYAAFHRCFSWLLFQTTAPCSLCPASIKHEGQTTLNLQGEDKHAPKTKGEKKNQHPSHFYPSFLAHFRFSDFKILRACPAVEEASSSLQNLMLNSPQGCLPSI